MSEADDRVTKLFTKGSHHRNISVMFIVQNFLVKTKSSVPLVSTATILLSSRIQETLRR